MNKEASIYQEAPNLMDELLFGEDLTANNNRTTASVIKNPDIAISTTITNDKNGKLAAVKAPIKSRFSRNDNLIDESILSSARRTINNFQTDYSEQFNAMVYATARASSADADGCGGVNENRMMSTQSSIFNMNNSIVLFDRNEHKKGEHKHCKNCGKDLKDGDKKVCSDCK